MDPNFYNNEDTIFLDDYITQLENEEINLYVECVPQVVSGVVQSLWVLGASVIISKIVQLSDCTRSLKIFVEFVLCNLLLLKIFEIDVVIITAFNMYSVAFIFLIKFCKVSTAKIIILCIIYLLLTQFVIGNELFLRARGILMTHAMRIITISWESNIMDVKSIIEYLYFSPTIMFGPYLTIEQFQDVKGHRFIKIKSELSMILRTILYICLSLLCLIFSSCVVESIPIYFDFIEQWLTAISFRFSHYFVSFLATSIIQLFGLTIITVDLLNIELASSISIIVIFWNIPMHNFLHKYIYSRINGNIFIKVLLTFLLSSLLHGIDIQITLTLMALGFIGFSENEFRRSLSKNLNCCIRARPCKDCCHKYKRESLLSSIVNFLFAMVTVYHLIFTGMPFTDDYAAVGYPFQHTISYWSSHYYLSFIISIFLLLLSRLM